MGSSRKFFKFFGFPAVMLIGIISFAGYMAWKEESMKSSLIGKALGGNRTAIAILEKYEKPWKLDERIIDEALKDNPHALQILKLGTDSKN
ncbi:MAG: hypothetical protein WB791_08380 [Waddliaceae bacterium]